MTRTVNKGIDYRVNGYTNKWSVIDSAYGYSLLENNKYGDETCYLVVRNTVIIKDKEYTKRNGDKVILPTINSVVCETYEDLITALVDEGIIIKLYN